MNTFYFYIALASFLLVMGSWAQYLSTVPRGIVPEWPTGSLIIQGAGFIGGIVAFATMSFEQPILAGLAIILAAVAISMMLFFYWLLFTQRRTPIGDLQVQVGDKLLPFSALTPEGKLFQSEELLGKRVLFKFFRGGW